VLVLGGGDGLALREITEAPSVESVTLVDLDPDMTKLSQRFPRWRADQHSISESQGHVVNDDAMIWIEKQTDLFDAAIVDFPDPNQFCAG